MNKVRGKVSDMDCESTIKLPKTNIHNLNEKSIFTKNILIKVISYNES